MLSIYEFSGKKLAFFTDYSPRCARSIAEGYDVSTYQLITSDAIAGLSTLAPGSINCCITSPPYFGLRDYGIVGQIGLERRPGEYVAKLVAVFRAVRRVLSDDGTLWLNLGDSYNAHPNQRKITDQVGLKQRTNRGASGAPSRSVIDLKPKDLIGIPWRVAFALQDDGWYLRSDIIWAKPNPMPESVTDRPTKSHEYLFLLSASPHYYYDYESIKEPASDTGRTNGRDGRLEESEARPPGSSPRTLKRLDYSKTGRNKRSVWSIPTDPYPEAHFATFPRALVDPCVLAGCPEGGTVLDPFMGSGTTGVVALSRNRNFIGIDLNPTYVAMAQGRLASTSPLFSEAIA